MEITETTAVTQEPLASVQNRGGGGGKVVYHHINCQTPEEFPQLIEQVPPNVTDLTIEGMLTLPGNNHLVAALTMLNDLPNLKNLTFGDAGPCWFYGEPITIPSLTHIDMLTFGSYVKMDTSPLRISYMSNIGSVIFNIYKGMGLPPDETIVECDHSILSKVMIGPVEDYAIPKLIFEFQNSLQ